MLRLEINVATIAAAIPALRPLWAKSANSNQKHREQARQTDKNRRLESAHVMINQQTETESFPSGLETRITTQGGKDQGDGGNEARSLPDRSGTMKTSDVSMENFRKVKGKWIPEHSSLSDGERSVEDMV